MSVTGESQDGSAAALLRQRVLSFLAGID